VIVLDGTWEGGREAERAGREGGKGMGEGVRRRGGKREGRGKKEGKGKEEGGMHAWVLAAGHSRHNVGLVDDAKEGVALRSDRMNGARTGGGEEGRGEAGYEQTYETDALYRNPSLPPPLPLPPS